MVELRQIRDKVSIKGQPEGPAGQRERMDATGLVVRAARRLGGAANGRIRCAIYARYSSDQQRHTSIEDQIRKCREFAESMGWEVVEVHIYIDTAISGSTTAGRLGFERMIEAARSKPKPFDYILVDDTSRFSRNMAQQIANVELLGFHKVYIYFVSQGIDTRDEQSFIQLYTYGMVDQLFLKGLADKTRRGLEGQFERGFWTGGRVYGYYTEKTEQGAVIKVKDEEARVVHSIFEQYAGGMGEKAIAAWLNQRGIAPPRGCRPTVRNYWGHTTIRHILRNSRYVGIWTYGRTTFKKNPETGRRVPREPERAPQVREIEELAIIDRELWNRVQDKRIRVSTPNVNRKRIQPGRFLLTQLAVCDLCGGPITITHRYGRDKIPVYGCKRRTSQGSTVCPNSLHVRAPDAERQILEGALIGLLNPDARDYWIKKFNEELARCANGVGNGQEAQAIESERVGIRGKIQNLLRAVEEGDGVASITERVKELESEDRLLANRIEELNSRKKVKLPKLDQKSFRAMLWEIPEILAQEPEQAREILRPFLGGMRWKPVVNEAGRFLQVKGEANVVDLLGEGCLVFADMKKGGSHRVPEGLSGGVLCHLQQAACHHPGNRPPRKWNEIGMIDPRKVPADMKPSAVISSFPPSRSGGRNFPHC